MKKKLIVLVLVIIALLSIYTTAFSKGEENYLVDFPEADYENGERFIYGNILKVDYKKRRLIIEQHMDDDNSQEVSPILNVREDAVIILKRNDKVMNIDLYDLKSDDMFGIVLDKLGMVRGIIIFVWRQGNLSFLSPKEYYLLKCWNIQTILI